MEFKFQKGTYWKVYILYFHSYLQLEQIFINKLLSALKKSKNSLHENEKFIFVRRRAFKVSIDSWVFSEVHNLFIREKARSTAAVVPGKQKPYSTNLSMPLTSIACVRKWVKISTHLLSHGRSLMAHSSNLAWLT